MRGNLAQAFIEDDMPQPVQHSTDQTLDQFLKLWADRTPDALAFSDAPNRNDFAIGQAKRLTFAEAHKTSYRLAKQFREHGLNPGDIIALQLPNIVELPIVVLAALRAGLIPCPFPFLWRSHEIEQALKLVHARALITVGDFNGYSYSEMMCELAFDQLRVRFIYGIGPKQADGVTSLDGFFKPQEQSGEEGQYHQLEQNQLNDGSYKACMDDPALITWSMRPGIGLKPIYRTHRELIAVGLMHVLELGLSPSDKLLNPYPLTGLIGLAGMFMPSLLIGASVIQHHPFNYKAFIDQMHFEKASYAAAPAPVLQALLDDGVLAKPPQHMKSFGCVWQMPHEKLSLAQATRACQLPIYDIRNLHETAVYISKHEDNTANGEIKLGDICSKEPNGNEMRLLETRFKGRMRSGTGGSSEKFCGTLFVRGASVPKDAGVSLTRRKSKINAASYDEWVNTGIQCYIDKKSSRMDRVVCEAHKDVIYHGGAMIFADELDKIYIEYEGFHDAAAFSYPDPVLGERIFAAIVPKDISNIDKLDFDKYLEQAGLAPYKIPEKLIIMSEIPKNTQGKVMRQKILNTV